MPEPAKVTLPTFVSFTETFHHEPYPFISPERPDLSVAGKNVVVTGSGSGIGRAIAIAFAQANAASVALIGRRLDPLKETAAAIAATAPSVQVFPTATDLTKRAAADDALAGIVEKVGKIDIFVSNASTGSNVGPFAGYDEAEVRDNWELNIMVSFNSVQAFLPRAAPGAKLFNVSSGGAHMAPIPGMWAYNMHKLAITKMFDYIAVEHPELHVVNVHPGVVATAMNKKSGAPAQDAGMCRQPQLRVSVD